MKLRGDTGAVEKVAQRPILDTIKERIKKARGLRMKWAYHGEARPAQLLSIRTIPDVGFGLPGDVSAAFQVLVRFETYQVQSLLLSLKRHFFKCFFFFGLYRVWRFTT